MKKKFSLMAVCMCLAICLAGCGASSETAAADTIENVEPGAANQITEEGFAGAGDEKAPQPTEHLQGAKRIYTANLNVETTKFDDASAGLSTLVETCGGWVQGSSVEYDGSGYRYANYVVRVPQEQFNSFLNEVGGICHITYRSTNVEDVTEYYYDTQGRLKTEQTKLERLQTLLEQAKNMEDIISIESAISETEQEIDLLSGDLRHYDAQVDYSTVDLTLKEVYQLSNVEEPATGFGSRVVKALSSGGYAFISFLQALVLTMAYGWVPLVLGVVVFVAVFRGYRKRGIGGKIGNKLLLQKKDDKQD